MLTADAVVSIGNEVNMVVYCCYMLYSSYKPLTLGRYWNAQISQKKGDDGDLCRIMFSAKYIL